MPTRLDSFREALGLEIAAVAPTPGTLLVFHPVEGLRLTETFVAFLSEELGRALPTSVRAIIVAENCLRITPIEPEVGDAVPPEIAQAYRSGWRDALLQLARVVGTPDPVALTSSAVPREPAP